ncbi:MAG TPA: hypothetical protein DD766_09680 [Desulfovibrio sp.]|nr:hypothetical protein [Desulfovibrio sp.]
MSRALMLCCLLALLAGCGPTWVNPYIASPREEDERFDSDSAQCREAAGDLKQAYEDCLTRRGWERQD